MKQTFKYPLNFYAIMLAITSFTLGTMLLLLFKNSGDTGLIAIGYFYTWLAAIGNTLMLVALLIHAAFRMGDFKEHTKAIIAILLNIPITLFYMHLVI